MLGDVHQQSLKVHVMMLGFESNADQTQRGSERNQC